MSLWQRCVISLRRCVNEIVDPFRWNTRFRRRAELLKKAMQPDADLDHIADEVRRERRCTGKEAVQVQAAVDAALKRVQLVLPLVLAIGLGSAAIGCSGRAREAIAADAIAYVVDAAGVSVRSRWRSEYDSAAAKAFADGKSRAAAIVELDRVEARFSRTASALDAVAAVQTRFVALLEQGIPPPLSALLAAYCDVRHAIQREYELPGVLPGGVSCP